MFISRAIACISAGERPVALGNTASGVSVNTSTCQKSKNRSAMAALLRSGTRCPLLMLPRQVFARADLPAAEGDTTIAVPASKGREDLAIRDRRVSDRVQLFPASLIPAMSRTSPAHGAGDLAPG